MKLNEILELDKARRHRELSLKLHLRNNICPKCDGHLESFHASDNIGIESNITYRCKSYPSCNFKHKE
jgi:tRNA(Ile2) C34 agmatinyltransferase TiaS